MSLFGVYAFFLTYPLPAGMKLSQFGDFMQFTVFNLVGAVPFFFGGLVIGMLLTPPDIISQTLLAVPMWLLFEMGIIFSRLAVRKTGGAETGEATGE